MPELPEVETVMRGLRGRLEGRRIRAAAVNRGDLRWALPPDLARTLTGARVLGLRRRGKYILIRLEGGRSLLLHLGMSGRIVLSEGAGPPALHEHLVLETDAGTRIGLIDPRRFGTLDLLATAEEDTHRLLAGLGPEPLDPGFTPAALSAALAGRRTSIKAALLDQRVVAGLGNIYVSEALHRGHVRPTRPAASLV
ncbi:MAG: bifunctional DNA-formamidopyrimidine glycosylase/DNA-(apurinic or apyrimidinic site) lyase, partial [Acetobacteraceae bacterium]